MKYKILITFFSLFFYLLSNATPTKVMIRAKAKDAKFIGSSIGGAYVTVKNKLTGEILSQGKTKGGTGNTTLIMKTARERDMMITDDTTSGFLAELDIAEPVFVSIQVVAPVNKKQASVTATTEIWVIPGKDILNDGVIVEIPGFIVDILTPRTHQFISLKTLSQKKVNIQANVVMMCGCTISKGGLWDAEKIEVNGIVKKNDTIIDQIKLVSTSPNLFEGNFITNETGTYEVIISAYAPNTGNTGVDKINYIITQ
ncbi:hypothetical protein [Aquimarina algicola]|uniref:DUF4198 domain-containing protein n=1 Tax=Aquimarina algicola TaxID=2589995 RepID=A0A504JFE5_9FLAO|nr:hypothetical protein [Aquimarina algicola]TPN85121.1 hypothetical protein FHK87_13905 [Aquimarina algicola]